jgi:hypothetical protein
MSLTPSSFATRATGPPDDRNKTTASFLNSGEYRIEVAVVQQQAGTLAPPK